MDASQSSRELAMLPVNLSSNPTEFSVGNKAHHTPQKLPSTQNMASPTVAKNYFQESIFNNSRPSGPPKPFSGNTERYIVIKTMKRQREEFKQSTSDSKATISEGSEVPKRRKIASENLALPSLTDTKVSAPATPPGDVTPRLEGTSSTFQPFTPDTSFELRHKRQGSRLSQITSSSSPARINEIDLFKVVMRDQNPLYYQPEEHSAVDVSTQAQSYVDLAQAHKKVLDFHGAETEFLKAFKMYNRSKGPDSPEVMRTMSSLAELYEDQSRPSEAPRRRRNCYVFCG